MLLQQYRRNVIYFPAEKKRFYNRCTGAEVHDPWNKIALQDTIDVQFSIAVVKHLQTLSAMQRIAADVASKNSITPDDHIVDNLIVQTIGGKFRYDPVAAGEIPGDVSKIVAVAAFIKFDWRIEIIFQNLDIPENRFGGTGDVEIFFNINPAHLPGERGAVGIAVRFELIDQPDDPEHLFFSDRHKIFSSFPCFNSSRNLAIFCRNSDYLYHTGQQAVAVWRI